MDEKADEAEWSDDEFYHATPLPTDMTAESVSKHDHISECYGESSSAELNPGEFIESKKGTSVSSENLEDDPNNTESMDEQIYVEKTGSDAETHMIRTEKGLDSDSEDDIPLAFMKQQKEMIAKALAARQQQTNEDSESSAIYDEDDDKDKTYIPSSDEGSSDISLKQVLSKKKPCLSRDKAWKKTATKIKLNSERGQTKRNKTNLSDKLREKIKGLQKRHKSQITERRNLEKARALSRKMQSVHNYIRRSHFQRLDKLLASNELKRVPVDSDGNCFFESIKIALNIPYENTEVRNKICNHITDNPEQYIGFFSTENQKRPYSTEQLSLDVENFRNSGQWNSQIGDCLPLAVANVYECTLRIFSSSLSTPVIDVKQSKVSNAAIQKLLCLAHIAVHGKEHYEATTTLKPLQCQPVPKKSINAHPTMKPEVGAMPGTPHKRATYKSPEKQTSSRKKHRNPNKWKRNIRKRKRNLGLEYTSVTGKKIPAKSLRPHSCTKCRFKCSQKFTKDERQSIFELFYRLDNYEQQRHYICNMVLQKEPVRKGKLKKSVSCSYFLSVENSQLKTKKKEFVVSFL